MVNVGFESFRPVKYSVLLIISLVVGLHVQVQAQEALEIPRKIVVGIEKGDAKSVALFFNDNLELAVLGTENIYSKRQAEFILQKFFRENVPQGFYIKHQGGKKNTTYFIADLTTTNGRFKMVILLKETDQLVKIHQLRIENE
jgi:hypothetical protein